MTMGERRDDDVGNKDAEPRSIMFCHFSARSIL